ncbi:coiled-coil domain-containing protein 12 [Silurus asotus]|uniref:Coiled-coil domain-containing protein 12 n=1 Tax=Silurus asotus TaxID=30991 RepID=A0AAD5ALZ5_SILAS|nr:coiled-coil domain-containing protein 12 [Silurus asotus]
MEQPPVSALQAQALKRKEKLKALRERQLQGRDQAEGEPESKRAAAAEEVETEDRHSSTVLKAGIVENVPDKLSVDILYVKNGGRAVLFQQVVRKDLKLRNYTPEDEELKERQVPKAKPASVEDKVKDQLEAANPEPVIEEVDLANLAPRKPDWDLKRDGAKKLEKLEKRTQKAIAELIRERLKGSETELAGAVGAVAEEEADSD